MRTKTDAVLAAAVEAHADDPQRAEVIVRARRFKASWIELAEALTDVRKAGAWKRWGYEAFEDYAKSELLLRQETVDKLTGSYQFLQRRAPEALRRDGVRAPIPDYHAVDFLRRAEDRGAAPSDVVDAMRKRVIEDAVPIASVSRQFKEIAFPVDEVTRRERDAAGLKNVASKLRELLGETHAVPRRLAAEVSAELDKLLEALAAKAA